MGVGWYIRSQNKSKFPVALLFSYLYLQFLRLWITIASLWWKLDIAPWTSLRCIFGLQIGSQKKISLAFVSKNSSGVFGSRDSKNVIRTRSLPCHFLILPSFMLAVPFVRSSPKSWFPISTQGINLPSSMKSRKTALFLQIFERKIFSLVQIESYLQLWTN